WVNAEKPWTGSPWALQNFIHCYISNSHPHSVFLRFRLIQPCRGNIDAGAGVFGQPNPEAGLAQIASCEKATDIRGDAADDDMVDAGGAKEGGEAGILRGDGVGIGIFVKSFSPHGVKALCVKAGNEVGSRRAGHAMRRIEVIALAEEAAMIGRMPILAGVDPCEWPGEKGVYVRHNFQPTSNGELARAERREALLHVDHEQAGGGEIDHDYKCAQKRSEPRTERSAVSGRHSPLTALRSVRGSD